jgi:hypothetical protein
MKKIQLIINVYNSETEEVEKLWNINGVRHRKDGPAIIEKECMMFFQYGKMAEHPEPAMIYANGEKVFYVNGRYSHLRDKS